jgi:hypothetical protein
MTKSKRQGLFVIPSEVEESLDAVIDRCLDFARHDSEYWLLHFSFVLSSSSACHAIARQRRVIRHSSF